MSTLFIYALLFVEVLIICALFAYVVYAGYLILFFRTAPYVPSKLVVVQDMFALARLSSGMHVLELGSGNGEICIRAAAQGAIATGIEANPMLVAYARWRARKRGVRDRAHFEKSNFWKIRFPFETDVVFLYLLPETMRRLYPKLCAELRPGTVVVSNSFPFPQIQPEEICGKALKYRLPQPSSRTS